MAWSFVSTKAQGPAVQEDTSISLPSSAGTGYSSEITFLNPDPTKNNKYISIVVTYSAISGTNIDLAIYGAWTTGGTKFLLYDAYIADQTTAGGATVAACIDLNAYPAPYYYLAHTVDADESANTISYRVVYH